MDFLFSLFFIRGHPYFHRNNSAIIELFYIWKRWREAVKLFRVLLKQSWFLSFLTVLGTVILFSLVGISVINFNSAHIEMKTIKNIGENNIYQISDSLINEKENEFFSSLSGYDKLYSFVNRMMSEDRFVYYKENWQPVYIADFKGGGRFSTHYISMEIQLQLLK